MLNRPALRRQLQALSLLAAGLAAGARAQPAPQTPLTIGSANTAVADPGLPRPSTSPCRVELFTDVPFADFSSKPFAYAPPGGCPGPWEKVVLEADWSVEAGRQFDRSANIWIGGVNVYFGTTAEPSHSVARSWHVERDLTDYTALLLAPAAGRTDLGNVVNSTYTSTLWGSAALVFYPARRRAPRTADLVLPLSGSPTGGTVALFSPADALGETFTLPGNVERAYLDVVLQHQGANDEFWFACVPDALSAALESCTGSGFREGEVSLDGQPVGVVPLYPWIFTGGLDPLLWRPIPGVQTLNFPPYRVDLTPLAAVLSDGAPHRLELSVFNNSQYFQTTATLLVFQDHGAKRVRGEVTQNTLGPPAPVITNGLSTAGDGTISGTLAVTASRSFVLAGWVQTSHGRVRTEVRQTIDFSNSQRFQVPATAAIDYLQDITQSTRLTSVTSVRGEEGVRESVVKMSWPLELDLRFPPDGATFESSVRQGYQRWESASGDGGEPFTSYVSNSVAPHDVYPTAQGQLNEQHYFSADSSGSCYSRSISAAGGVLTSVTDGAGCGRADE